MSVIVISGGNIMNFNEHLEKAKTWAREMGKIQLSNFRKTALKIETKSSSVDLVTEVDKACEKYILYQLSSSYPEHSILSEESGQNDIESDYQWIIDPLDGTTNYAHGIPVFAVSIAMQFKGETVMGVVYCPMLDEMYTAVKGQGAYLNDETQLQISQKVTLEESILVTGFPYDKAKNPNNNAVIFAEFVPQVRGLRRDGSAATNLAYLAAGFTDGFWELNLGAWDVAAGILLIEEAGGTVEYLEEHRGISIMAGNELIIEQMRDVIKAIGVL